MTLSNIGENLAPKGTHIHWWKERKISTTILENSLASLRLKIRMPGEPGIPAQGILLNRNVCTCVPVKISKNANKTENTQTSFTRMGTL